MSLNDIYNSSFATLVAEVATLPICTLKTCYQTHHNGFGIKDVIFEIYNKNGVKGFYKASFPAIGSQVLSTSSKYYFYKFYLNKFSWKQEKPGMREKMFSGWLSGVTSSLITHPLDFFKVKIQSSLTNNNNITIANEIKNNGVSVFYRGYSKSFAKVSIGSILFFPLTDLFQEYIDNIVLSSASSAIVSTIIMHPLDYLKTRQISGHDKLYHSQNIKLYKKVLFYYKGLTLNLLRIVPHFTITMSIINLKFF